MKKAEYRRIPFCEMLFLVVLMFLGAFVIPEYRGLFVILLPIIYFVLESFVRRRIKKTVTLKEIQTNFKQSWFQILLVGFIFQVFFTLLYVFIFPDVLEHVKDRTSFLFSQNILILIITIIIAALGEEVVFRGLIQRRLGWVLPPVSSIFITSLIFALIHVTKGDPVLVIIDLSTVFIDSIMYGVIYHKTKSILFSWLAHFLANFTAAVLILIF